jgi:hypothetical protein
MPCSEKRLPAEDVHGSCKQQQQQHNGKTYIAYSHSDWMPHPEPCLEIPQGLCQQPHRQQQRQHGSKVPAGVVQRHMTVLLHVFMATSAR